MIYMRKQLSPELAALIRNADQGGESHGSLDGHVQVIELKQLELTSLTLQNTAESEVNTSSESRGIPPSVCHQTGPEHVLKIPFHHENEITWYTPYFKGAILSVDIETTGLGDADMITCVCAYDQVRGIEFTWINRDMSEDPCYELLILLDQAPLIAAFNGVRFDLPFIAKRWGVSSNRLGSWIIKTIDLFEASKIYLGETFSLNQLLHQNGVLGKTSSGIEAVEMAMKKEWDKLADYCMNDAKKVHDTLRRNRIRIPKRCT